MESLLCDEVLWLSSPAPSPSPLVLETGHCDKKHSSTVVASNNVIDAFHMTKEDCEQALSICLKEEKSIDIPKPDYVQFLVSKNLIAARSKSIQWFIKSRNRLNLSIETVFYAANYFDRFISLNLCDEWIDWMVELLSVACLSIASKFGDNNNNTPTLHEINQTEDDVSEYQYSFEPSTIQRMELVILKALDWRLACTTAHSYVEMFTHTIMSNDLRRIQMINQVNELLLGAISDTKMLEFRPSVVALSALRCCLDTLHDSTSSILPHHSSLTRFFSQEQKDKLARCHEIMDMYRFRSRLLCNFVAHEGQYNYYSPSSPTTVLLREHINPCDLHVDLSPFQIILEDPNNNPDQSRSRKKPRSEVRNTMN